MSSSSESSPSRPPDTTHSSDPVSPPSAANPPQSGDRPASGTESARWAWDRATAFETVLIAGGVVLFLVLLYEMHLPPEESGFLNPPLVALAGTILLWPVRRQKAARALLFSGGALLLLWVMNKISSILIPFVAVYLLAYLLNPILSHFDRRFRVPRWLSSLLVTIFVAGGIGVLIVTLAPSVAAQVDALSQRILEGVGDMRAWLASSALLDSLEAAGLIEKQAALQEIQELVRQQAQRLPGAAEDLAASIGSALSVVVILALVPVLLFYTLKDYPTIQSSLIDLFPTAGGRRDYVIDAGSIVGQYLRGQLMISTIAAFNVSVLLFAFDISFWLIIGLLAGLFNFVPQLGAIITLVIGTSLAFVFGGWVEVFVVAGVLLGENLLEQSILTPNILSYQVGIHPLLVLFSLLAFGTFLGVFGLLIAVPATAIIVAAYQACREELTFELNEYGDAGGPTGEDEPSPPTVSASA